MKYKLLAAAAVLLASAGAQAQSSVTMYGIADVGVQYLTKADGVHNGASMTSGNYSGSRWGLRGVEDLGGGLKGIFTLESGFNMDTGSAADSSRLFNRQAFVGVQGDFGALTLGRQQSPLYDFGLIYDPMALASHYSIGVQDAWMASSRADNAIKYVGGFGGLTASAMYSFGYAPGGELPGDSKEHREFAAGLNYASGPFSIGGVYEYLQPATTATDGVDLKVQRAALGATYAFGPAKLYGGYRWYHANVIGLGDRNNLWWLGLGYQVTPALSLTGAAYYQAIRHTAADPWSFVASMDYSLSKRTDMYLNLGYALNRTDNGMFSTITLDSTNAPANPAEKYNQFGAVVGVRHRF